MVARAADNLATLAPSSCVSALVNSLVLTSTNVVNSERLSGRGNAPPFPERVAIKASRSSWRTLAGSSNRATCAAGSGWTIDCPATSLETLADSRNLARRLSPSCSSETNRALSSSCVANLFWALATYCSHKVTWTSRGGSCAARFALFNAFWSTTTSGAVASPSAVNVWSCTRLLGLVRHLSTTNSTMWGPPTTFGPRSRTNLRLTRLLRRLARIGCWPLLCRWPGSSDNLEPPRWHFDRLPSPSWHPSFLRTVAKAKVNTRRKT